MPQIDLSILNQRQTPAFYADTLANRPSAGFIGRIFVSTNTFEFYRDNGTTWDLIGGPGTSTVTGTGANGQVTYWNGASSITGSNDLFFDAVNGHFGVGTITPGTALDVKHNQNTVVQLEQETATNDTRIAFINSGVGLWRLGAFYNAGANDFGIFDIAAAAQPVTVKRTTGQVLIGTSTVGSGKLVVASSTGDNGVQIVGASAPSLRIDNAESGPTKRAGFGISTAVNNFIQGSADRDFCMFNGSTTSSPILFGIYGTTNVVEAARISSAFNFLIGGVVDNGRKLQVTGDASFSTNGLFGGSNNPGNAGAFTVSVGVPGTTAGGIQLWAATNQTHYLQFGDGTASADNYRGSVGYNHNTDSLTLATASVDRLIINSLGYIGVGTTPIEKFTNNGLIAINGASVTSFYVGNNNAGFIDYSSGDTRIGSQSAAGNSTIQFYTTSGGYTNINERARITSSGNLLIGTTTDAGQKLQVSGTTRITGDTTITSTTASTSPTTGALVVSGGIGFAGVINGGTAGFSGNTFSYFNRNDAGTVLKIQNQTAITQVDFLSSGTTYANIYTNSANGSLSFYTGVLNLVLKSNGVINMPNLPTSAVGLVSGDIYSNLGVLTIVP